MPNGQAITGAQGTLVGDGGDNNFGVTGSASTSAAGAPVSGPIIPLRSRKVGGGTASPQLVGAMISGSTGTLTVSEKEVTLTGVAMTGQQGTLTYWGLATLSWIPPADPDVASYKVFHGTVSGFYDEIIPIGNVTTYQLSVPPGFTHYFALKALDASGNESARSNEVSKDY